MDKNEITREEYEKKIDLLERRLREMQDHLKRFDYCFKAIHEGRDIDIEFLDSEIYTEEYNNHDIAAGTIPRIIEHLLKIKYCTNNRNYHKWIEFELSPWINKVIDVLDYRNSKENNKVLVKEMRESMDKFYSNGIKNYDKDSKIFTDLLENRKFIPKECMFTLDDLLTLPLTDLLNKLPDPDDLTTQIQLYPFCKYYQEYEKIRGIQCKECKNYETCKTKYFEMRYDV